MCLSTSSHKNHLATKTPTTSPSIVERCGSSVNGTCECVWVKVTRSQLKAIKADDWPNRVLAKEKKSLLFKWKMNWSVNMKATVAQYYSMAFHSVYIYPASRLMQNVTQCRLLRDSLYTYVCIWNKDKNRPIPANNVTLASIVHRSQLS